MEKQKKQHKGFYVEKGSFFVHAAVTILALSMVFRLLGTLHCWGDMFQLATQIALPVGSAVLMILFLLFFGRIALWTTILPVLGGAAFFILAEVDHNPSWPMFICIALAFLAVFVYTATLTNLIRTKWLNVIVFLGILVYQCWAVAYPAFVLAAEPISFAEGMALLSAIGIVLSMLLVSLAIRRRKPVKEEVELPKIKDPVVLAPETEEAAENQAEPAGNEEVSIPEEPVAVEPAGDDTLDSLLIDSSEPGTGSESEQ